MSKKDAKNIKEQAVTAALDLAAERSWDGISLADIAARAEIPLAELFDHIEDRFDILAAYGRMIDRRVLEAASGPDSGLSIRDRLFDLLMERFDVLNENRAGVTSIIKSFCYDPKQAVISLPHLGRSMSWMLEAAGADTGGVKGAIKVAGLSGLYIKTLRVWKNDESPDMGKTMAALDKYLGRAERWAGNFGL